MTTSPNIYEIFELLQQALATKAHPLRFFYLATQAEGSYPGLRTIVLRGVFPEFTLEFFTDRRSDKVRHIETDPRVTALFYDPEAQLQITARGEAILTVERQEVQRLWDEVPEWNRKDYRSAAAPGTVLDDSGEQTTTISTENEPSPHFQPVRIRVTSLDVLQLNPVGHLRHTFELGRGGSWERRRIQA